MFKLIQCFANLFWRVVSGQSEWLRALPGVGQIESSASVPMTNGITIIGR